MTAAYTEHWRNPSWRNPVTVPAGAGPANPGDLETWDLAGPWQGWPVLDQPWHILRVYDPALPGEIMRVAGPAPGPAQVRVIRGDQGTTPVPHPPGFALMNSISAEGLAARAQGIPSGRGLLLPPGQVHTPPTTTTAVAQYVVMAAVQVRAGEAVPGSVYEAVVHGYWTPGAAGRPIQFGQLWGDVRLGWGSWTLGTPNNEPAAQLRWRLHGIIAIHEEGAVGSLEAQVTKMNTSNDASPMYLGGELGPVPVEVVAPVQYSIYVDLEVAGMSATAQGGRAWRAA
jgi:hypothetical protein